VAGLAYLYSGLAPTPLSAGGYLFANEENGPDIITHPSGYTGTGGVLDVEVCIDSTVPDAQAMEISVRNVVTELNRMTASTPNLFFGGNNNIPAGLIDFESLALHEEGHCTGLSHVNLGAVPGVQGSDRNFTASTAGADSNYDLDASADGIIGSSDDQRGDDINLHWFEKGVNNPFLEIAAPDSITYGRDLADLPGNHAFAINADRTVAVQLGFNNTEAVMQQGQGTDEEQRLLSADDVTTFRMGMSGMDSHAGTPDDYTINMVYGGIRTDVSNCDIVIESRTTGFGSCSVSGQFLNADHVRITSATVTYNSDLTWYFNTVLVDGGSECGAQDDELVFANVVQTGTQNHSACVKINYGPDYTLTAGGEVTATAPSVSLGPNTSISGIFTVRSEIP
jgi:hypothetical protein